MSDGIIEAPPPLTNEEIEELRRYLARFTPTAPIPKTVPITDRQRQSKWEISAKLEAGACRWCLENEWVQTTEGPVCAICAGIYTEVHNEPIPR